MLHLGTEEIAKLDKLWAYIQSDHFNRLYEDVIRQESFITKIKAGQPSMPLTSPFNELVASQVSSEAQVSVLVHNVKELIDILETQADPSLLQDNTEILRRIQQIKLSLQWM